MEDEVFDAERIFLDAMDDFTVIFHGDRVFVRGQEYSVGQCVVDILNLEEEELIVRIQDEEDGRYKKIVFTDKAEMIRGALRGEIEKTEELLLKGITPEEQEIFMKITAKMLENLQQEE